MTATLEGSPAKILDGVAVALIIVPSERVVVTGTLRESSLFVTTSEPDATHRTNSRNLLNHLAFSSNFRNSSRFCQIFPLEALFALNSSRNGTRAAGEDEVYRAAIPRVMH